MLGLVGQVGEFVGVGFEVIEFFARALLVVGDDSGGLGVGDRGGFPASPVGQAVAVGRAVDVGGVLEFGVQVEDVLPGAGRERRGWGRRSCGRRRCGW